MHAPLAFGITTLLALTSGLALWPKPQPRSATDTEKVATATAAWLAELTTEQRALAQRPLGDGERTQWNFVPGRYAGLELGAMTPAQTEAAHAVLRALLSAPGYAKTQAIAGLENLLHELESTGGRDASHRDPVRYALLVFGDPAPAGTYTVRFQGHHVSLQFAVHEGKAVSHTPQFLGTNPHEVLAGKQRGMRVLGAEEDLARAFLFLLDDTQLTVAVIAPDAPPDVLLGPGKPPAALGARRGLPWQDMTETQRGVLWRLLEEYANLWHGDLAKAELQRIRGKDLDQLSFAWAGSRQRGQGHYYRIHGSDFAIEYDNTQNEANHVHTLWRDFTRDFGGDLLRRHLEDQHGKK